VQIFFLALFKEKVKKLKKIIGYGKQPSGYPVSGLTGYPALQSGFRPDTGYKKRPDIRCIPSFPDPIPDPGLIC
jgi:hypothetical protein